MLVSYSHKDRRWLERLQVHLAPQARDGKVEYWDDTRIHPGMAWRIEVERTLAECELAILLVSADFLASDFVSRVELPALLTRRPEVKILPVVVSTTDLEASPLGALQFVNEPTRPVNAMEPAEQERVWAAVARWVRDLSPDVTAPVRTGGDVWTVPFERNLFFTGRSTELGALARRLETSAKTAIVGLGGIGKTQLAVEYAHRHRTRYQQILWADAATDYALTASVVQLAKALGLAEWKDSAHTRAVDAVRGWLERNDHWLLILDRADRPSVARTFLPHDPRGHVVVTSRSIALQPLGIADPLHLSEMLPDEAVAFLVTRVQRGSSNDAAEQSAASSLAAELGYLPLALEQAGAHVCANQARFQDYLKSYRRRRVGMLPAPVAGDYPESVATTWTMNFREVEQVPAAGDLLHLCAFLGPDNIPVSVVARGAKYLGPAISEALAHVDKDPLVLDETLEPLCRYSLVTRDLGARTFSLHRIMQAVILDGMEEAAQRTWAERAIRAVRASFPIPDVDNWDACARLIAHAQACAGHVERWKFDFVEAGMLLHDAADYLRRRARFREAMHLEQQVLAVRERLFGPEHGSVAESLRVLARIHRDLGQYANAEAALRRALAIEERGSDPTQLRVARVLNSLSALCRDLRRAQDAESLVRRSLDIREGQLGADHPVVAQTLTNLAAALRDLGRLEEAEETARRALAIEERALGPEHHNLATSLTLIAGLCRAQERLDEAERLVRRAVALDDRTLGPDHPNVAFSLCVLAEILAEGGRFDESKTLYERALRNREQWLGEDHPLVRETRQRYAELLDRMGRREDARVVRLRSA